MSSPSAALFATTVFASAFLIFFVQPMVGKHILPWFGGAPSVWTLCLAFYQLTLFLGYGYAHLLNERVRIQPPADRPRDLVRQRAAGPARSPR